MITEEIQYSFRPKNIKTYMDWTTVAYLYLPWCALALHDKYVCKSLPFIPVWQFRKGEKKLAQSFNYTFRYIDDVLSLNNKNFSNFLHLIYPVERVVKDTTYSPNSASYLTFTLNMTLMEPWQLHFMINGTILTFLLSTIPFSTVTSRHLLHMVFTCRS